MDSKISRELLFRWLLAGGAFAVLIFFFSPSWGAFRLWSRVPEMQGMLEVRRGASVLAQVAQPGAEITDPLHRAIQWRLLFPLVGRVFQLPPPFLFGLAHLGCLLALGYIVTLLRRRNLAWADCGLAAVTLGAASWFFTSTGWLGYWDSWLALALLFVAFAEARWAVWFACVWAPWIDERFVIAAPLALLCRHLSNPEPTGQRFDWRRDLAPPAALLAGFLLVRLGVLAGHSGSGATIGGYLGSRDFLDAPAPRIALGIWDGLRTGWIFLTAAFVLLWLRPAPGAGPAAKLPPKSVPLLFGGAVLAVMAVGLATAQDYSRSMTMLLPAALLGLLLAAQLRAAWLPLALRAGAIAALLLPAHHVMNDRVNPIFYLYHELAALKNPPAGAMPELYELRAIHKMQRGEFAQAEADLTLAIRLADHPASAVQQRGVLRASQGRWPDALLDFSAMVEHDPKNPDAWLMRAQANHALGHTATARADIDRALSLAPDGWSARPDVTRFLAKLNRTP